MRWPLYWLAFFGTLLLFASACDLPTEYTVHSPECPWPPPSVLDASVTAIPLGCPWTDENGNVISGWWR